MSSPTLFAGKKPETPRAVSSRLETISSSSFCASSKSSWALRADGGVFKDSRIDALELPGVKEGSPIDQRHQCLESDTVADAHAGK